MCGEYTEISNCIMSILYECNPKSQFFIIVKIDFLKAVKKIPAIMQIITRNVDTTPKHNPASKFST